MKPVSWRVVLSSLAACYAHVSAVGDPSQPPVLVYQMRADYAALVPVLLSADHQRVISYPAPADLRGPAGTLRLPVPLARGYWLDRRGIGPGVAFLRLTYVQYAHRAAAPSLDSLRSLILDARPLVRLCDCGPRNGYPADPAAVLRPLAARGRLAVRCKILVDNSK